MTRAEKIWTTISLLAAIASFLYFLQSGKDAYGLLSIGLFSSFMQGVRTAIKSRINYDY